MLNKLLTFDSGSVIFWSITYICVIVRGFKGEKLLLPSLSIYLNLGWEICSIFVNNNWKNWLWLLLDCVIFIIMIIQKKKRICRRKEKLKNNHRDSCFDPYSRQFYSCFFDRKRNAFFKLRY